MNKKWVLLMLFSGTNFFGLQPNKPHEKKSDQMGVTILNTNNNQHNIQVHNESGDPDDCSKLIGNQLKERMRWITDKKLTENLIKFDAHKRMMFAKALDADEAQALLQRLNAEHLSELQKKLGIHAVEFIDHLKSTVTLNEGQMKCDGGISVSFLLLMLIIL